MQKKLISIVITTLVFTSLLFFNPLTSVQSVPAESILYVDDDNTAGPWDGSNDYPFKTISEAINTSENNTIIYIYPGTYEENIFINKNVKIQGENKNKTIVLGSFNIINSENVAISELTINGNTDNIIETIGIILNSTKNSIIKNTVITQHTIGIYISEKSSNNLIKENQIRSNTIGIDICSCSNNLVYGNAIHYNQQTNLILYKSSNNKITQNTITNSANNLQFHSSKDKIIHNYWGNEKNIQFFTGKTNLGPFNLIIPWIKILFQPHTSPDQLLINPIAIMDTSLGSMSFELYPDQMPITTQNFIELTTIDFFNDLIFHRVIDDFVIQGGGFYADGRSKESPFESIPLETHPDITHVDGAISMARTNDPNSATSQFFICDGAQHFLDGDYAAFGKILIGFETLQKIASVETTTKHSLKDWPINEVTINEVLIS
ncbi:MAG: peptidylprolyl isomerase [Candidatus Thermoplasmatota archaeon]|nr:peptidylprolyl isomerase [Candidatus Thermoplasmatota archaeon]